MPSGKAVWTRGMQFVGISGSGHGVVVDSKPDQGGLGSGPTPVELTLMGLCGCTGMDVVGILKKKRIEFTDFQVEAEGEIAWEPAKHLSRIELVFKIWGDDVPASALEQAINLSQEKYCTVSNTLRGAAELSFRYEINPEE